MRAITILITVIATFYVVPATSQETPAPQAPPQPITVNINGKDRTYPAIDKNPSANDPQVKAWLNEIDLSKVPDLPISNGGKLNPQMAQCDPPTVILPNQGSWTCQKFTAEDDIQNCPTIGNWGLTYDDGPSESTPKLLDKLKEKNLKATFFVVGSRVAKNPKILKDAFDAGHNIAVHTWSHPALTSLSNEGIVAELKWTLQIIKDVTGVTPLYMRPPYGDTDNRVRAVAKACGLKTVLWEPEFDSNDWTLTATPPKQIDYVLGVFETWMQKFPKMKTGFIVLEHDLHPESVQAAMEILDRAVKVPNLNITTVPECVGDTKPYLELGGGVKGLTEENKNGVAESSINAAFITTISMFVILSSLLI